MVPWVYPYPGHHVVSPSLSPEVFMARYAVSKSKSVRKFNAQKSKTKAINLAGPMRGGIRL